ncbi:MAG: hypothetical protein U9P80_01630 [Thermodesulfobacteriota bacterium]|nr:hypothetical protein [Thermodesulfobacteriota bacterium]
MKVDPNMIVGTVGPVKHNQATHMGAFEDLLKGAEAKEGISGTKEVGSIVPMASPDLFKIEALSRSEQALDMLEGYSNAMADPSVGLGSLSSMVDELSDMKDNLKHASMAVSTDDPLRAMMDELDSTIASEIMRFKRGDLVG